MARVTLEITSSANLCYWIIRGETIVAIALVVAIAMTIEVKNINDPSHIFAGSGLLGSIMVIVLARWWHNWKETLK